VSVRVSTRRALGVCGASVLLLAGCAHNTEDTGAPLTSLAPQAKVDSIAALLPAKIKNSGTMVIGVDDTYPPNEFKDSSGAIVGFDIDLMKAVAQVLGVTPKFVESSFEKIIPAIQMGTFDASMSSFTDTVEREKSVDFTDYFSAGIQWAQHAGKPAIDPDNACGLKVSVQATTEEDTTEVPAKSAACVAAGKSPIVKSSFNDQTAATTALMMGQVDAMSADSPVTAYAVKQSNGALVQTGPLYEAAPYGWPVAKGSTLAKALQLAIQQLIDTGVYQKICDAWGVGAGMITKSVINGPGQ